MPPSSSPALTSLLFLLRGLPDSLPAFCLHPTSEPIYPSFIPVVPWSLWEAGCRTECRVGAIFCGVSLVAGLVGAKNRVGDKASVGFEQKCFSPAPPTGLRVVEDEGKVIALVL